MTERHTSRGDRPEAGRYEIRVAGHLDARWAAWFDGLTVCHGGDGTTLISGPIADQAALHGLPSECVTSACRCPGHSDETDPRQRSGQARQLP
jgi:hypothetical protein